MTDKKVMDSVTEDVWLVSCRAFEEAMDQVYPGPIAGAIMDERERCAKIAESLNGWGSDNGAGGHALHIAKIIREG